MLVDREEFSESLTRVKPALSSGGVVQELTHIWFDGKTATAYDGGFGIKLKLPSELECGVPGAALLAMLSTSALKEAGLEQGETSLELKLGKSKSKLAVLEASRIVWPFPAKMPKNSEPTALGDAFVEALRKVLFVKASPPTRVEHHGVLVEAVKKDLVLYTTDSATIASATVKGAAAHTTFERLLLPRDFAEQIVAQSSAGVELFALKDCLIAVGEGITYYSNLLDISGAEDMGAIVAAQLESHPEAVPLPAGLEGALSRAEILSSRDNEGDIVTLVIKGSALLLTGDYGLGKLNESLELEGSPPAATIRIKAGLLRRALSHADSLSITKGSMLLRSGTEFTYVVAEL